jgi:uncharacterized protein YprB with RNaseH-like and TPR domain
LRCAIFDLETSSLYADTGILLCAVVKEYRSKDKPAVIRADSFPEWKTDRANTKPCVMATIKALENFDIYVAHNGNFFDKTMLMSWALEFGCRVDLRFSKFIDPVMIARRHMRLSRRSLHNLLQFLRIPEKKTDILWQHWMKATLNGDTKSLNYIVDHCVADVLALEKAYDQVKRLVKGIDERGSSF